MSPLSKSRRWRAAVTWSLSAALLLGYVLLKESPSTPPVAEAMRQAGPQLPDEDRGREIIEVTEVRPGEANPGSAVEVTFINTFANKARPLRAWMSVTDYKAGRQQAASELEVLRADDGRMIVRIPPQAFEGRAKLRVGYDKDDRSKPYDLRIQDVSYRKLFREVLGGLALLFFGLRVMSRGSRQYAGDRGQGVLAQVGKRRSAA
ncbi:MAG TPA: hypothetical protein VGG33_19415, partial [Polyangia bacterium]